MNLYSFPMMPIPPDVRESKRWDQTRLRRRLLDGAWKDDLNDRLRSHLGTTRREAWGALDMSANPFRVICRELSVLYDRTPQVLHSEESALPLVGPRGAVHESGLWSSMRRFQSWVIGCREYLLRVHVSADGIVRYRPVPPDMVHAIANPDAPDEPLKICELRLRKRANGDPVWTYDVLDIREKYNPKYQIFAAKGFYKDNAVDLTEEFLGRDMSGYNYPYVKKDGTPVLPYQLYHAERLGDRLWDPYEMIECVEGSLNLAVGYSMWYHVLRDSSWPQRWMANARIAGLDVSAGDSPRAEIVTDPAAVLMLESLDDGQQVMVGQWQSGGDVEKMEASLQSFAQRLAQDAGLGASDIQRMSGNARSGYAIALTNSGKREVARRFAPQQRWADEALMARTAIIFNRATGSAYPESGYEVVYYEVPLSAQEKEAQRRDVFERLDRGFISPAQAKAEMEPGLTVGQAAQELARVRALRRGMEDR